LCRLAEHAGGVDIADVGRLRHMPGDPRQVDRLARVAPGEQVLGDAMVDATTLGRTDVVVQGIGDELMEQRPRTVTAGDDDAAPLELVERAGDRGLVELRQLGHEI
jgi:hypothetical protein